MTELSSPYLSEEESQIFRALLRLTGREERLTRDPLLYKEEENGLHAIWSQLKNARIKRIDAGGCCDLLNRLLLTLGINPVSETWYNTVFDLVDMSELEKVENRIDDFRILCMLEFGNIRYGYKQLRKGEIVPGKKRGIVEMWKEYFPDPDVVDMREKEIKNRPEPSGLIPISAGQLFSLGYLAKEYAPSINDARSKLCSFFSHAEEQGVKNYNEFLRVSQIEKTDYFPDLLAKAGIPSTDDLIYGDLPLQARERSYGQILSEIREQCVIIDEKAISQIRSDGTQNAHTYMAMHDLDVYVATSMREPLNFTTNREFVQCLFHKGELADQHIHYFDPTQAHLEDRVQKGLLECLMIKRAKLCVYNAQEADTFGKDAEAGVTLAQGKPVIVYVARFGENLDALKSLYCAIDIASKYEQGEYIDYLINEGFIESSKKTVFLTPEKTKADAIVEAVRVGAASALKDIGDIKIRSELINQGYTTPANTDIYNYAAERISKLERRAMTFRDIHPLSLQTSPIDGVARGVMVTRTVEDTARVIKGILLGNLRYTIDENENNWLLLETITNSPVRVVTKNSILSTAFWSESWQG